MKNTIMKGFEFNWLNRKSKIILGLLLVIALILRVYRLGVFTLWLDEFPFAFYVRDLLSGKTSLGAIGDKFGLLIVFITMPFVKLFGENEFWLRFPTMLFGVGSVYLTFVLAKKTLGTKTAIAATLMITISLFGIFYSRIFRYYSSLQFFYTLLIIVFYEYFENAPEGKGFLGKIKVDKRFLIVFPITLIVAIISGAQSIFAFFGFTSYFLIMSIVGVFQFKSISKILNKYSVFALPLTVASMFFIVPSLQNIVKPVITMFLSEDAYYKMMPDWNYIHSIEKKNFWAAWINYIDVFRYDYKIVLFYITIPGIVIATIRNYKMGIIIFSFLIVPLLLMSFLFRGQYLPWYGTYYYPLYMILSAVSLVFLADMLYALLARFTKNTNSTIPKKKRKEIISVEERESLPKFVFAILVIAIVLLAPIKGVKSLLQNEDMGQVVRRELFKSSMVDWKKNVQRMKKLISKDDVLMATWLPGVKYYMERDDILFFRQRRYDGVEKKYVPLEVDTISRNANSYEGLLHLMKTTSTKINLISDYSYFYNVMTDPQTRQLVERNFHYHFGLVQSGEFALWTYDPHIPIKRRSFVYDLGKKFSPIGNKTPDIKITLNQQHLQYRYGYIIIQLQGVDFDQEGAIRINDKTTINLPKNKSTEIEEVEIKVETKNLVEGENKVVIFYGPPAKVAYKDITRGFAVYNLGMRFANE